MYKVSSFLLQLPLERRNLILNALELPRVHLLSENIRIILGNDDVSLNLQPRKLFLKDPNIRIICLVHGSSNA